MLWKRDGNRVIVYEDEDYRCYIDLHEHLRDLTITKSIIDTDLILNTIVNLSELLEAARMVLDSQETCTHKPMLALQEVLAKCTSGST